MRRSTSSIFDDLIKRLENAGGYRTRLSCCRSIRVRGVVKLAKALLCQSSYLRYRIGTLATLNTCPAQGRERSKLSCPEGSELHVGCGILHFLYKYIYALVGVQGDLARYCILSARLRTFSQNIGS